MSRRSAHYHDDPAVSVGEHELSSEEARTDVKILLDDGRALTWQYPVDTAHAAYRESRLEVEYEFDPTRFTDVTSPPSLLADTESPPQYGGASPQSITCSRTVGSRSSMDTLPSPHISYKIPATLDCAVGA